MLRALYALSDKAGTLSHEAERAARHSRGAFLTRSCVRYVVMDRQRTSSPLRNFAVDALQLELVTQDDAYELWTPVDPPTCQSPESSPKAHD